MKNPDHRTTEPASRVMDPRTFLIGAIAGIAITIGSFALVSAIAGVKWQPVVVRAA